MVWAAARVPSTSQQAGPLDANVGDAIEEFMHYAEELKHHVAKGVVGSGCNPRGRSCVKSV